MYVATEGFVLAAVWPNRAIPGMTLVLLGGAANLAVIIGVGVAVAIVAAMHGPGPVRSGTDPSSVARPVLPADGPLEGRRAP